MARCRSRSSCPIAFATDALGIRERLVDAPRGRQSRCESDCRRRARRQRPERPPRRQRLQLGRSPCIDRHDDARGRLPEQRRDVAESRRRAASTAGTSTSAPNAVSKQHSASVTARPPSAQSCADRIRPLATPSTSTRCSAASRSRSSSGGTPRTSPCTTFRYSLPPSSPRSHRAARRRRRRAERPARPRVAASSISPTTPSTGVGRIAFAVRLVVEADVAAGDRDVERAARRANTLDRARELPHDLRPLGIAEVQAVGRADRQAAGARDVPRRLGHR